MAQVMPGIQMNPYTAMNPYVQAPSTPHAWPMPVSSAPMPPVIPVIPVSPAVPVVQAPPVTVPPQGSPSSGYQATLDQLRLMSQEVAQAPVSPPQAEQAPQALDGLFKQLDKLVDRLLAPAPQQPSKPEAKPEAKPKNEAKPEPKPESKPKTQPKAETKPKTQPKAQPKAEPKPQPKSATHTVTRGDTLSSIARATLGDSGRWREIYDLNKGAIGSNPNVLQAGMVLTLPGGAKPAASAKPAPAGKLPVMNQDNFISQYRSASNTNEDAARNGNCGPTSLTMIAEAFGKINVTPASANKAIEETRRRMGAGTTQSSEYNGTSYAQLQQGAKSYGLSSKVLYGSTAEIQKELKAGRLVIAHVRPDYLFPGTTSGHYAVVTKIADGKVYMHDPANSKGPMVVSEATFKKAQKGRGTWGLVSVGR